VQQARVRAWSRQAKPSALPYQCIADQVQPLASQASSSSSAEASRSQRQTGAARRAARDLSEGAHRTAAAGRGQVPVRLVQRRAHVQQAEQGVEQVVVRRRLRGAARRQARSSAAVGRKPSENHITIGTCFCTSGAMA
jgi:hypothetical protein